MDCVASEAEPRLLRSAPHNRPGWTIPRPNGIRAARHPRTGRSDETLSAQDLHMVERPDLRHPIMDLAVRRTGRRGRAGQSIFPYHWRQDRSRARLRAALGDLQWLCRSEPGAAVMARLAASHR